MRRDAKRDEASRSGLEVFALAAGTLDYSEWGHTRWTTDKDTAFSVRLALDEPINWSGPGEHQARRITFSTAATGDWRSGGTCATLMARWRSSSASQARSRKPIDSIARTSHGPPPARGCWLRFN